ncbi:MAG: hypothetical protein Q9190_008007 [Brigantiaea leucoxantha]
MGPIPELHHHRSSSKNSHKPFKSRHATKGLIKELAKGKIERLQKGSRQTPHQQVMSKLDRRNQAKQLRQSKHQEHVKASSVFSGQDGAPRVIAIVPLCGYCDTTDTIQKLNGSAGLDLPPPSGLARLRVDRFKQNLLYVSAKRGLFETMDLCRAADFVVFVLSSELEVDEDGEHLLRAIESQGVSNVVTVVQNLDKIQPSKKQPQVLSSLKSYINHFFPQEKVYSLDSDRECANIVRSLCSTTPQGVKWREDRSWMVVEEVQWPEVKSNSETYGEVAFTGVVRGNGWKANRLVQVGDWGHFQVGSITHATLPPLKKRRVDAMAMDHLVTSDTLLEAPDTEQDDLDDLAPYEEHMSDVDDAPVSESFTGKKGVLLDDHYYFSDDETHLPQVPRRLPKGTSSYQAAWFLGDDLDSFSDESEEANDQGDVAMQGAPLPQDGVEGLDKTTQHDPTEAAVSEYPQSEMFLDPSPDEEAAQLADYRAQRKNQVQEDLEFPDEIELSPNVLARERLSRYRGLKSLRTSRWETAEDRAHEPEDWNRLLQVSDYKHARKQIVNEALVGGVPAGQRVSIHLKNIPLSLQDTYDATKPLAAFSLLRHEQKRAVVNFTITLSSEASSSLKSKETLILQCGPRRLQINPLFSQTGSSPNSVHKFLRYLHPGQTAMATFIAPVTWGSVPALYFKSSPSTDEEGPSGRFELVATGTSQPPSSSRVIAKRVILTGHPYKIHKRLVTVRYMFFNKEDVEWFKALQLWTQRGRSGFIKESLGTHGYFKATFDGRINTQDAVGISLYKRVFPRHAKAWAPERHTVENTEAMRVDS